MAEEDFAESVSRGNSVDKATEQQEAANVDHGFSQLKYLASSTSYPTKRAISFTEIEDRESKKLFSSQGNTTTRLNRSLASADKKRANTEYAYKVSKRWYAEKRLALIKVKNVKRVSNCVKAAISNGHIKIIGSATHDLNRAIIKGPLKCGHDCTATLADVLYQPDFVGVEPHTLSRLTTVFCSHYKKDEICPEGWAFVTGMCKGKPRFDWTGESVNHCKKCDCVFGKCVGDFKSIHCPKCGEHYSSAFCANCYPDTKGSHSDSSQNSSDTLEL